MSLTAPRGIEIRFEVERGKGNVGTMIYLSNLGNHITEDDIRILFSDVGDLESCAIHYNKNGRSKGTGEVVFFRQSDAVRAMNRFNNFPLDGKLMKLEEVGVNLQIPNVRPRPHTLPVVTPRNPRGSFAGLMQRVAGYGRDGEGSKERFAGTGTMPRKLSGNQHNREKSHQKRVNSVMQRVAGYARDGEGGKERFAGTGSRPHKPSGNQHNREKSHQKRVTAADLDADLEGYRLKRSRNRL